MVLAEVITLLRREMPVAHAHHGVLGFVLVAIGWVWLVPVVFALVFFIRLTAPMVIAAFVLLGFDLEDGDLLVISIIVRFRIDDEVVAFA